MTKTAPIAAAAATTTTKSTFKIKSTTVSKSSAVAVPQISEFQKTLNKGRKRKKTSNEKQSVQGNDDARPSQSSSAKWNSLKIAYPYETNYNDHFVTPGVAYEHIAPILVFLLQRKKERSARDSASGSVPLSETSPAGICYDPFYCDGSVVQRLGDVLHHPCPASAGVDAGVAHWTVLNERRDFYADIASGTVPPHDFLVTNPPYSADHKERCLRHVVGGGRPWALLLPGYVANRRYYCEGVLSRFRDRSAGGGDEGAVPGIFYVVPPLPYRYSHPEGTGKADPPFDSLWFVGIGMELLGKDGDVGEMGDRLIKFYASWFEDVAASNRPRLMSSIGELRRFGALRAEAEERGRGNARSRKRRKKREHRKNPAGVEVMAGDNTAVKAKIVLKAETVVRHDIRKHVVQGVGKRRSETVRGGAKGKRRAKKGVSKYRDEKGLRKKKRF